MKAKKRNLNNKFSFEVPLRSIVIGIAVLISVLGIFSGKKTRESLIAAFNLLGPKHNFAISMPSPKVTPSPVVTQEDLVSPVKKFYGYIASKQYDDAWNMLSKNFQGYALGHDTFVNGYTTTLNVFLEDIHVKDLSKELVYVKLQSIDKNDGTFQNKEFEGTWKLVLEGGTWKLDTADIVTTRITKVPPGIDFGLPAPFNPPSPSPDSDPLVSCGPFPKSKMTLVLRSSVCANYTDCEYPNNVWSPKTKDECASLQSKLPNSEKSSRPPSSENTDCIFPKSQSTWRLTKDECANVYVDCLENGWLWLVEKKTSCDAYQAEEKNKAQQQGLPVPDIQQSKPIVGSP